MQAIFDQTISVMSKTFPAIESSVGQPEFVPMHGDFVFRYKEQTLEQAIVQKLARVISGLGAAQILLEHGFVQELFAIQRMLDEFSQDIIFLCLPLHGEPRTELHEKYLTAFYEEEFEDGVDPLTSPQRRDMIPRKKIRAAIANSAVAGPNPSREIELHRTLDKTFSGFVHGASPQIMEMYGGPVPHFHIKGMLETPRMEEATKSIWNYFYRGLCDQNLVAMCFGLTDVVAPLEHLRTEYEALDN